MRSPREQILRLRWVADILAEQRRLASICGVGRDDLVLDVGSGAGPWPRANVLCDKFVADGTERHGSPLIADRPLVIGDAQALPFKDNAFDFVVCSHVLEHVEDPERAAAELSRVARRGYVETPSAEFERLVGFPFHRWMVSRSGDRLVFEAKRGPVEDPPLRAWFDALVQQLGIESRIWLERRELHVYTCLVWVGRLSVEVRGVPGKTHAEFEAANAMATDSVSEPRSGQLNRLLQRWGVLMRRRSDRRLAASGLQALWACPRCRGNLEGEEAVLRCHDCRSSFERNESGVPVLL